jgi:hypothetical protein
MGYAESNQARAREVNLGAGFHFASSLKLTTTELPYTLSGGDQRLVEYDMTGGVGTVTLPAEPDDWMQFEFCESANVATALTIDGNGNTISGSATFVLSTANRTRILRYVPATGVAAAEWKIVGGIG